MMKKSVFLGASNTFGVALWFFRDYYKNIDNVPNIYPYPSINNDDFEFVGTHRFSKLLSNYLNLEEFNVGEAGGSPAQSIHLLSKMNLDEIEYVVLEFSSIYSFFDRYLFDGMTDNSIIPKTPGEIESFLTNGKNDNIELREKIYKWLNDFNPIEFTHEVFKTVHEFIKNHNNLKFIILMWRDYSIDFSNENNKWILNYTPKFPLINDENNIFVENYLQENKITVSDEFEHISKIEFPYGTRELHPSINGHKKIFEILKSYIDEKKVTNMW